MRVRLLVALTVAAAINGAPGASAANAAETPRSKITEPAQPIAVTSKEAAILSRYGNLIRGLILNEARRTPKISVLMLSLFSFGRTAVACFGINSNGKLVYVTISNDYNTIAVYDFVTTVVRRASVNFPPPPTFVKNNIVSLRIPLGFDDLK
jgi:hypothetical protein